MVGEGACWLSVLVCRDVEESRRGYGSVAGGIEKIVRLRALHFGRSKVIERRLERDLVNALGIGDWCLVALCILEKMKGIKIGQEGDACRNECGILSEKKSMRERLIEYMLHGIVNCVSEREGMLQRIDAHACKVYIRSVFQ
ncbi:hypothetical protein Tco_0772211 [Tanacetum coccineum]|uniref:Uncharacterized protein n=1 Tax=Tanacetum coccineum TaxID=301880 RepID=A0ABQ4ZKN1_9ASTR